MNAMLVPPQPKIYHIAHVDRLPSIIATGGLVADALVQAQALDGTIIGMSNIKKRRLTLPLGSHPGLNVGHCVPFYFCPRSVMLYLIHRANHPDLVYLQGQGSILHFEADLRTVVAWADAQHTRWAFTLSNAGSCFFEDRSDLEHLKEINWTAVLASNWSALKEGKQAEFLLERCFPWHLVQRIGVQSTNVYHQVVNALPVHGHRPMIEVLPEWYY